MINPISSSNYQGSYVDVEPKYQEIVSILAEAGIDRTPEDIEAALVDQNIEDLTPLLSSLSDAKVLTLEIFNDVIKSPYLCALAKSVALLQKPGLLNIENVKKVVCHSNPVDLAQALSLLQQKERLNQRNFEHVVKHMHLSDWICVLSYCEQMKLSQRVVDYIIVHHPDLSSLNKALCCLQGTEHVNVKNFEDIISKFRNCGAYRIKEIADILCLVKEIDALDKENFQLIMASQKPDDSIYIYLYQIFSFLKRNSEFGLFNAHNAKAILKRQDLVLNSKLGNALLNLKQAGILNQETFDSVIGSIHLPDVSFILLKNAGLYLPENMEAIQGHSQPDILMRALIYLNRASILDERNRRVIACKTNIQRENAEHLTKAIFYLKEIQILDQNSFDALVTADSEKFDDLIQALFNLKEAQILNREIFFFCMCNLHKFNASLNKILDKLQQQSILNLEIFHAVMNYMQNMDRLLEFITWMREGRLLTQENLITFMECPGLDRDEAFRRFNLLAPIFLHLQQANILTPENKAAIRNHLGLSQLANIFDCLSRAGILTQENFDVLIRQPNLSHLVAVLGRLARCTTAVEAGLTQARFASYIEFYHLIGDRFSQIQSDFFTIELFDTTIERCRRGHTAQQISTHITTYAMSRTVERTGFNIDP